MNNKVYCVYLCERHGILTNDDLKEHNNLSALNCHKKIYKKINSELVKVKCRNKIRYAKLIELEDSLVELKM